MMTRDDLRLWAKHQQRGAITVVECPFAAILQALDELDSAKAMIESMRRSTTKRPYPEFTNHS